MTLVIVECLSLLCLFSSTGSAGFDWLFLMGAFSLPACSSSLSSWRINRYQCYRRNTKQGKWTWLRGWSLAEHWLSHLTLTWAGQDAVVTTWFAGKFIIMMINSFLKNYLHIIHECQRHFIIDTFLMPWLKIQIT